MKIKIPAPAFIAVSAGIFVFLHAKNASPFDLRGAAEGLGFDTVIADFEEAGVDLPEVKVSGESGAGAAAGPGPGAAQINPLKYLATLQFDGKAYWNTGEQNFPQPFVFNTTQDANGDGEIDADDALENLVRYKIGRDVYGKGRSGLPDRGPNDQRPAVYFHYVVRGGYRVYEYWLYYADNDYWNDHEHDWERYFVYESLLTGLPERIVISRHNQMREYDWGKFPMDEGHPSIGVIGGGHAMREAAQDGVRIRYNGEISANNGRLDAGDGQNIPWLIFSNDPGVKGAISYVRQPDCFNYGDPRYFRNRDEYGDLRPAPWKRVLWDDPQYADQGDTEEFSD
ncbi:MAG: hypothetical protein KKH28_05270 [Elusimicrobia bacterium]|nr:hypothetical protein [Elusimicrobiota bacterium]